MNQHRYNLEPYRGRNTRYDCPSCGKRKEFTRYIDTQTGEHIAPSVGKCNKEINCGYHYSPKQYFQDNQTYSEGFSTVLKKAVKPQATLFIKPKPVSFIPVDIFKASLKSLDANNFVKFLIDLFGIEVTNKLISRYFIGTSKHWDGATVFWQIDITGNIRTGKIMLYSPATGKRSKSPYHKPNWVQSVLKLPEFNLRQCLFGEHLLGLPENKCKPVAIVESEKTAVIASIYLPQFIWLAVGSLNSLNAEKCSVLKGQNVTLFPDLNGYQIWSSRAKELSSIAYFTVSDLLERKSTEQERNQGLDLADYLVRFDYRDFLSEPEYSDKNDWTYRLTPNEIAELEQMLNTIGKRGFPKIFQLDEKTKITDVEAFISAHMEIIKSRQVFEPALRRLIKFISLN